MKIVKGTFLLLLLLVFPITASALQYELSFTADVIGLEAGATWDLDYLDTESSIGSVTGSVVFTVPEIDTEADSIGFSYELFCDELSLDLAFAVDDFSWVADILGFAAGTLDYNYSEETLSGAGALLAFFDCHWPWDEGALADSLLPTTFDLDDWDFGLFAYVGAGISEAGIDFAGIAGKVTSASIVERVPEPASIILLGTGFLCLAAVGRKRHLRK